MTEPGPHDMKVSGNKPPPGKALSKKWTMASLDEVVENLKREGVYDRDKLRFVVGDVCMTLRDGAVHDKIALLRLDTDWYESTKKELEVLWPRLVSGGVLIVDDYGHWMGAKKAVDEYLCAADRERLQQIDYTAVILEKQ
jgi:predicted O-methyltransferase YrrM